MDEIFCRDGQCEMMPRWTKRFCQSPLKRRLGLAIGALLLVYIIAKLSENNSHVDDNLIKADSKNEREIVRKRTKRIDHDNSIHVSDTFIHEQTLQGVVIRKDGDQFKQIPKKHEISTSLLYTFKTEPRHASDMFADTPAENDYYMICPAMHWHRGKIVAVLRLWINYEGRKHTPKNEWYDNYLYAETFHKNLTKVEPGSLLGIPSIQQFHYGTGQLDPRLFEINDTLYVNFHMKYPPHNAYERTYVWDYDNHKLMMPWYDKYPEDQADKNWSSMVINGILHYVHWINPLIIMRCENITKCTKIFIEEHSPKLKYGQRGGTPFQLYIWPYYIAITHSVVKTKNNHRLYYAHVTLLCVEPYELVYTSDPIEVHNDILSSCPVIRHWIIDEPFIYPTGIIIEDPDTLAVGIHANDCRSFIIRIKGVAQLARDAIAEHKTKG
ncbi:unnamed protein product [Owenia fusiformis]|uniref:Uncharacterized protein n=1 Tax=Owenia fusiformis TaxID=6347 RepID=A0A8J1TJ31_OWEFU|nr:unnamed protein product [Owenia fusiformis]